MTSYIPKRTSTSQDHHLTDIILFLLALYAFANHGQINILPFCIYIGTYFLLRLLKLSFHRISIILSFCGVWQSVIALCQFAGLFRSNHSLFALTGDFGNPGQLGCFLALSVICTVGAIDFRKKIYSSFSVLILLLQTAVLILSDSRTGWLAVLAGLLVYIWHRCDNRYLRRAIIFLPIIVAPLLYLYKAPSANGRLLVWKVSARMIADKPVFGHGPNGFDQKYMLYQADYFRENPSSSLIRYSDNIAYPYNEFLHMAATCGCAGLLLFALLTIYIWRKAKNKHIKAALAAYSVVCLFSYPSYVIGISTVLFAILAGIQNEDDGSRFNESAKYIIHSVIMLLIVSCATVGIIEYLHKRECRQLIYDMANGRNSSPANDNMFEFILRHADLSEIYANAAISRLDVNQRLPILLRINTSYPSVELCVEIGDCHAESGNIDAAISYYAKAHHMVPRRIAPTYKLFCIYKNAGDPEQAVKYASEISTFPHYIIGTKALRIKREALDYLRTQQDGC